MYKLGYLTIILTWVVFSFRLWYLQIHSNRENIFNNSAVKAVTTYPERGYIYDRNKELIVGNQLSYDIFLTPSKIKPFDTITLCNLLNITKKDFIDTYNKARKKSRVQPYPLITQLSSKEFSFIKEKIYKYDWLSTKKLSARYYNQKIAANVMGYIGEVNENDITKSDYYKQGDYIGKQGLEKQYEKELRGTKGVAYVQKDRFNREIGLFKNGSYDTLAKRGKDIKISIDSKLQAYGQKLMKNKHGGIVAIDPNTGEILALVSAPTYDPSLLVGRLRSKNYTKLYNDSISKPLYDRTLLALYPPGSTIKPLMALTGLQELLISPQTEIVCKHGYRYGPHSFMKCHCDFGTVNNLRKAIYLSCNTYFAHVYKRIVSRGVTSAKGIDKWGNYLKSFGLGEYLSYDLPNGKSGKVPDSNTYNLKYGKNHWYYTYTMSNSIGQGEVLVTPIQMANVVATIANRGYYYTPHFIKKIDEKRLDNPKYKTRHYSIIEKRFFAPVIRGMADVYRYGTAKNLKIKRINIAGKTGTVENYVRINGKREKLADHSVFMAFAPIEKPKIAILVFVENGFWGNLYAGPIASLCIEKYIRGTISRKDLEDRMFNSSLEEEYKRPYIVESASKSEEKNNE